MNKDINKKIMILNQVRSFSFEIKCKCEKINNLQAVIDNVSGCNFNDSGGKSGDKNPKFVRTIEKINKLELEIKQEIDKNIDLYHDVSVKISRLENTSQRIVLSEYYINCKSWDAIAESMNYSVRQVYNIRDKALKEIEI